MIKETRMSINQNINIKDLIATYGSPLYVYDSNRIIASYNKLKQFCGDKVDIFYSLKANPNKSVAKLLVNCGASAEVCSSAELQNVLSIGVSGEKIIFVGPYKSDEDIVKSIKNGVYAIVFESFNEVERINNLAAELGVKARVIARINPEFNSKDALLKMGGKASQFGIDQPIVYERLNVIDTYTNIQLIGMHIYNGTRILNVNTILDNTRNIFSIAKDLQNRFNLKFECVDIGGGVGVPYFEDEEEIDLASGAETFHSIVDDYLKDFPQTKIIMESGRYLVAESGLFVSKIQDTKNSKGKKFLVTDGGTNCHMAAVGVGSIIKKNFPVENITSDSKEYLMYEVTGPLCTPNDLIAKSVSLTSSSVGDLICIKNSGAYGPSASPVYFLSHGFPAEVMLYKDRHFLIRKRDTIDDINGKQINFFDNEELKSE